jgi:hypothetical protein
MGFEDLDEAAGEQSKDKEEDSTSETTSETTTETDSETTTDHERESEQTDPYKEPAFPFVQGDMQMNIYARKETREAQEETQKFEVDRILHEHGVKNVAGREHHDAIFRMAADHPELWARYVMEARGLDIPADLNEG